MAIIKSPLTRYHIIDRELRRNHYVKTAHLKKSIEKSLQKSVSERMINNDIQAMISDPDLGYNAPIKYNNGKKAYYYSDKNYTITAFNLRDEDINALLFYASTLDLYKEYEIFNGLSNAIQKVLDAVKIKSISHSDRPRAIILMEKVPYYSGSDLLPQIIQALEQNNEVKFDYYTKFDRSNKDRRHIMPYFLKQDKFRWYLVGRPIDGKDFRTYALDRIDNFCVTETVFIPETFDAEEHFKYSFGITVAEVPPVDVVISFKPSEKEYLNTLSIHETQKIVQDNENAFVISVKVKPSYEFYSKILSYGPDAKIVSPKHVADFLSGKLQEALGEYQK